MISRACYVACDVCHAPAEVSTGGAKMAREYANRQGFVRVYRGGRFLDLCPEHATTNDDQEMESQCTHWHLHPLMHPIRCTRPAGHEGCHQVGSESWNNAAGKYLPEEIR